MAMGFTDSDAEAQTAQDLRDNAVHAIQKQLALQRARPSARFCKDEDCGVEIPEARREAVLGVQYCVHCAPKHTPRQQNIRMVTKML